MDFTVENMKASDWQQVSQIYLDGIMLTSQNHHTQRLPIGA